MVPVSACPKPLPNLGMLPESTEPLQMRPEPSVRSCGVSGSGFAVVFRAAAWTELVNNFETPARINY